MSYKNIGLFYISLYETLNPMKKITCLFLFVFILIAGLTFGQMVGKKAFDNYYLRKGITPPETLKTKNVFYFTSTFPFSIGRIENSDEWRLNPAFSVGNGGIFVFGKSTCYEDHSRRIVPMFAFGIAADVGVRQELGEMNTTFNGNLMIGLHWVNLMLGYDFLNNTNYFGLALRVDLISFSPNSLYVFSEKDPKKLK